MDKQAPEYNQLTNLLVVTSHPERYLLVNRHDNSVYRGTTGGWKDSGLYLDEEDQLLQRDP